jgi:hypothetical protein
MLLGWTARWAELDVLAPPFLGRGPVSADIMHSRIPPFRRFSGTTLGRAFRHAQELGCVPSGEQGRHAGSIARVCLSPRCVPLPGEEPLREGGDKGDFDEQADDGLTRREDGQRVVEHHVLAGHEAAPVERCNAEHGGAQRV